MAGRGGKYQKRHLGRNEYFRQKREDGNDREVNKERNDEEQAQKKRKIENGEAPVPIYATQFSAEDIAAEERRPKKKVAVMIGYSGTGYHGMQLSPTEKTIEGDLFAAFVAAGAISKANAADPKKSSLVRCARTDRGVHAAGNVVSLKLIVEDPDIVQKINDNLSPQIRVWGYETVTKGFSCYQLCDSRMYEYLIPTHCFLPPHPSTHLGKKTVQLAEENEDMEGFLARQEGVLDFWQNIDENEIKPILEKVPEEIRRLVQRALYIEEDGDKGTAVDKEPPQSVNVIAKLEKAQETSASEAGAQQPSDVQEEAPKPKLTAEQKEIINTSIKQIKAAYQNAKRAYRIPQNRLQRVQDALDKYIGTRNFHNYTIQKTFRDPSSKRIIKSFVANKEPIIINGTEWVSLKVHGQSFMMHQIRKMVAMVALIAPGLGLLLEHPIFDSYNKRAAKEFNRETIDFGKYEKEMNEFKQREIYDRIFREEEESNAFGIFFNHVDHYPANTFLYLTSAGIVASQAPDGPTKSQKGERAEEVLAGIESEPEEDASGAEGG
uniref:tRNA pseudouridine synthase 1 n=1 Tax=Talaromyces marneffei PM1 TaxID=1077442 RepID=A0A093VL82_TALMA